MSRIGALGRTAVLAVMLGGLPVVGSAHTQPSAREDNIWGGKAHQPTQSEVVQQERLEGLALPAQQERLANDEVETLYHSLLQESARPVDVQPYVIPTPAPSSPSSPQQTQPAAPSLPDRGAPVFGLGGIAGTVTSNNGRFATVTPQGGGPVGIITPQGNGIGLLSVPGRAPTIVLARP
jgi:hypothetical protein